MKKTVKKLALAKETLRNLAGAELGQAAGGTTNDVGCPTWNTCVCESINFSCDRTDPVNTN